MVPFRCDSNTFSPSDAERASLLSLARIPKSDSIERRSENTPSWEPAVDIFEDANQFIIEVELPGINPEFVDIDLSDNSLLIHSAQPQNLERNLAPYRIRESSQTRLNRERIPFNRHIALPALVNLDHAEARHENGVLTVHLPKSKPSVPKLIKIQFEN